MCTLEDAMIIIHAIVLVLYVFHLLVINLNKDLIIFLPMKNRIILLL